MKILENLIFTKEEDNIRYTYCYRLTSDDFNLEIEDKLYQLTTYGIEVERQDILCGNVENIERDQISNISPYRHKVKGLLNMIYKNNVSPLHLVEVLGHLVDECSYDFQQGWSLESV